MKRTAIAVVVVLASLIGVRPAFAGFTETLPKGVILIEAFYAKSRIDSRWDGEGKSVPLIDEIERYEPGAGKQGVLVPEAVAEFDIFVAQLQVGILDSLSLGIGVPVILRSTVDPNLKWEKGDWQWNIGRSYSEEDFWEWAASMGQPKPEKWVGNEGVLSDIIVGSRWRFSDLIPKFKEIDSAMALFVYYAIPTGRSGDPEEVVTAGTTSWDLHAAGDMGFHVSYDKFFKKELDGRLTLGFDAFYEIFFPRRLRTSDGTKNPLLLTYSPYVGKYYTLDPGDFIGSSVQVDVVPYRGPALRTWLTKKDPNKGKNLPPILNVSLRYTFRYMLQSDWDSKSAIWDWEREKEWRPGYKNILYGKLTVSLLRVGVPLMPYVAYRNLTLIPGKYARPADAFIVGVQIPMKVGGGL